MHQAFEHLVHPHAALGTAGHGIGGIDADDLLDFVLDAIGIGLWQGHLVQDRHDFQALLDGGVAVGDGLGLDTLAGIDHQQRPFARRQRARDFIGEVDVAGGIDEVELVDLAVLGLVVERDAVGLDGDPAFALQVHGVEHLGFHFARSQATAHLNETVGQRRLAMVDVGDDGEIADMTQITHGSTLGKGCEPDARRKIAGNCT